MKLVAPAMRTTSGPRATDCSRMMTGRPVASEPLPCHTRDGFPSRTRRSVRSST